MGYWVLKDGKRLGPFVALQVIEVAGPETPVSYEGTWFPLESHPDFGGSTKPSSQPPAEPQPTTQSPSTDTRQSGKYWVIENGHAIGPLEAAAVVNRSKADTLVNYGQEWVPLRKHPDFGHVALPHTPRPKPTPTGPTAVPVAPAAPHGAGPSIPAPPRTLNSETQPTGASSSPRIRRLANDYERVKSRFENWPLIEVEFHGGTPPNIYRVWYKIKGLYVANEGEILERDQHVVEIKLGLQYPRRPPQCKLLTPLFHPNFNNTEVCAQDNYAAAEGLDDLIVRIGQMIAYQEYNTKSPLNGIAAKWADEHSAMLPVDSRNLCPKMDQNGADSPSPQDASAQSSQRLNEVASGTG